MRLHAIAVALVAFPAVAAAQAPSPTWTEIGLLFAERCVMCHSGDAAPLGVRLDTLDNALAGGVNGPVLVAGDPGASELVRRIRGESQPAMPLAGEPLAAEQIALVEAWVMAGMPAGDAAAAAPIPAAPPMPGPGEPVTFAHVEAIFLRSCVVCHSDGGQMGPPPEGLRLDTLEGILGGGDRIVVIPGRADASEIVRRITGVGDPPMPLGGPPIPEAEIDLIRRWIDAGAPDANGMAAAMPVGGEVRIEGRLTGPNEIDGIRFAVTAATDSSDVPAVGGEAEMRGVVEADGTIRATRFGDD